MKRLNPLAGTARVAEALSEVNGKLTWGTPKNHERRTVRLPRFHCDERAAYLSIKALQKQLGHKDAVQTLNRYGHLYPDELDSLAQRLEAVDERARAEAAATPERPKSARTVAEIGKAAGQ